MSFQITFFIKSKQLMHIITIKQTIVIKSNKNLILPHAAHSSVQIYNFVASPFPFLIFPFLLF